MSSDAEPCLKPTRRDAVESRARLLDAAGEAFARAGFQDASLRTICEAAGVNLGAVKYYFGSKQAMYRELLLEAHREVLSKNEMPILDDFPDPKRAFADWIEWFLGVLLTRAQHPYLGRLVANEIAQPTPALDHLVREVFINVRFELERIVASLAGNRPDRKKLADVTNMTLMLCVMHEIARPIIQHFGYQPPSKSADIKRLAGTVMRYALGGIRESAR